MPPKQEQPVKKAYTGTEEEEGYECLGWVRQSWTANPPLHYLSFFQGCWWSNSSNVKNLKRSIFVSVSDQGEDRYTSVNKGSWPYRCGFTTCIHWDMMLKQWFSPRTAPEVEL